MVPAYSSGYATFPRDPDAHHAGIAAIHLAARNSAYLDVDPYTVKKFFGYKNFLLLYPLGDKVVGSVDARS